MNLFRVTMTGHGLQLLVENAEAINAGFVKNEFVLAESENLARERAIELVRGQLEEQAAAGGVVLGDIDIGVDEVERSLKFWKLLQQEGFVFFPEETSKPDDVLVH